MNPFKFDTYSEYENYLRKSPSINRPYRYLLSIKLNDNVECNKLNREAVPWSTGKIKSYPARTSWFDIEDLLYGLAETYGECIKRAYVLVEDNKSDTIGVIQDIRNLNHFKNGLKEFEGNKKRKIDLTKPRHKKPLKFKSKRKTCSCKK